MGACPKTPLDSTGCNDRWTASAKAPSSVAFALHDNLRYIESSSLLASGRFARTPTFGGYPSDEEFLDRLLGT